MGRLGKGLGQPGPFLVPGPRLGKVPQGQEGGLQVADGPLHLTLGLWSAGTKDHRLDPQGPQQGRPLVMDARRAGMRHNDRKAPIHHPPGMSSCLPSGIPRATVVRRPRKFSERQTTTRECPTESQSGTTKGSPRTETNTAHGTLTQPWPSATRVEAKSRQRTSYLPGEVVQITLRAFQSPARRASSPRYRAVSTLIEAGSVPSPRAGAPGVRGLGLV